MSGVPGLRAVSAVQGVSAMDGDGRGTGLPCGKIKAAEEGTIQEIGIALSSSLCIVENQIRFIFEVKSAKNICFTGAVRIHKCLLSIKCLFQ